MERFVQAENVTKFVLHLRSATDPAQRNRLKSALIAEEDKLGSRSERLGKVEHRIGDCRAHIARQENLLRKLKSAGGDIGEAERVLSNLYEILAVFLNYKQILMEGLARSECELTSK